MQNCLGAPSDFGLMYVFLSFLCEFEPLKLGIDMRIILNYKLFCVIFVMDCDRNQFGAGLNLGEDFGRDIRKTRETQPDFQLEILTLFYGQVKDRLGLRTFFSHKLVMQRNHQSGLMVNL